MFMAQGCNQGLIQTTDEADTFFREGPPQYKHIAGITVSQLPQALAC